MWIKFWALLISHTSISLELFNSLRHLQINFPTCSLQTRSFPLLPYLHHQVANAHWKVKNLFSYHMLEKLCEYWRLEGWILSSRSMWKVISIWLTSGMWWGFKKPCKGRNVTMDWKNLLSHTEDVFEGRHTFLQSGKIIFAST